MLTCGRALLRWTSTGSTSLSRKAPSGRSAGWACPTCTMRQTDCHQVRLLRVAHALLRRDVVTGKDGRIELVESLPEGHPGRASGRAARGRRNGRLSTRSAGTILNRSHCTISCRSQPDLGMTGTAWSGCWNSMPHGIDVVRILLSALPTDRPARPIYRTKAEKGRLLMECGPAPSGAAGAGPMASVVGRLAERVRASGIGEVLNAKRTSAEAVIARAGQAARSPLD